MIYSSIKTFLYIFFISCPLFFTACKKKETLSNQAIPLHRDPNLKDAETSSKYDKNGFDVNGFNSRGFNENGYDNEGFNENGYDNEGFNVFGLDVDGYDNEGFDFEGFNKDGIDRNQNKKFAINEATNSQLNFLNPFTANPFTTNTFINFNPFSYNQHTNDQSESDNDQIIQSKIQNLPNAKDAQEFIKIFAEDSKKFPHFKKTLEFNSQLADSIYPLVDDFFNLNPSVDECIQFIKNIESVNSPSELNLIMEIKLRSLQLTSKGSDYARIMSEISKNAFDNRAYFESNTELILTTISVFSSKPEISLKSIKILIQFLKNTHLFNPNAFDIFKLNTINELRAQLNEKNKNITQLIEEILRKKVSKLYNSIQPNLNGKIQYYFMNDSIESDEEGEEIDNNDFTCSICFEDISADNLKELPQSLIQLANKHQICPSCLGDKVHSDMLDNNFPVTVFKNQKLKEIELNDEILNTLQYSFKNSRGDTEQKNFEKNDVRIIKIRTLISYLRELFNLQKLNQNFKKNDTQALKLPEYQICTNIKCGNYIFSSEINEHQHYECELCGESGCYVCNEKAHYKISCADAKVKSTRSAYDLNSRIRPCPWCYHPTEKEGKYITTYKECNHMTCPSCWNSWNYIKGKIREYSNSHDWNDKYDSNGIEILPKRQYLIPSDPGFIMGQDMDCAYPLSDGEIVNK